MSEHYFELCGSNKPLLCHEIITISSFKQLILYHKNKVIYTDQIFRCLIFFKIQDHNDAIVMQFGESLVLM